MVLNSRIKLEPDSKPDSNDIIAFYGIFHINLDQNSAANDLKIDTSQKEILVSLWQKIGVFL